MTCSWTAGYETCTKEKMLLNELLTEPERKTNPSILRQANNFPVRIIRQQQRLLAVI